MFVPMRRRGVWIEPLVQIHDDLVLEFDPAVLRETNEMMVKGMTQVPAHLLSVPIKTDGKWGNNWADLQKIES